MRDKSKRNNMNKTLKNSKKTTPVNHSSFWAGDFFDSFDRYDKADPKRVWKLSKGKRSIANFVTIATGKRVPVIFNSRGNSYTDSKSVVIGADIDSPKQFDIAVGLALHEASHIVHTNFDILNKLEDLIGDERFAKAEALNIRKYEVKSTVKDFLNVVEDRRLDQLSFDSAPGYREYYRKMYDKYFNYRAIDAALGSSEHTDETIESYMFRIINIHNSNTRLKALKGLPEIWNAINLKNINRLKTTEDAFAVALEVFDIMLKYLEKANQVDEKSQNGSEKGDSSESGDSSTSPESSSNGEETQDSQDSGSSSSPDVSIEMGEGDDSEDSDGSGGVSADSGDVDGQSTSTDDGDSPSQLSDKLKRELENAIKKQRKFLRGDVDKKTISKNDAKQVKAFDDNNAEIRNASEEFTYDGSPIEVMVVNRITKNFLDGSMRNNPIAESTPQYTDEVNEGIRKGRILGKKLTIRSESRTTVYNRQKTGKIDKRMISALGFGNENVFFFNEVDEFKDANLHISLDASSSMDGEKWRKSIVNVTAICVAVSMIQGLEVQVTLRSGSYVGNGYMPYIAKVYDSREDKLSKIKWLFPYLDPRGTTPEGLCFEAIEKDFISKSTKRDSYFLNISDGEPYFSGSTGTSGFKYSGEKAFDHTRKMMKRLESRGIKVLSYFVGRGEPGETTKENFRRMYGKGASFIDLTSINQITRTINGLFLEK